MLRNIGYHLFNAFHPLLDNIISNLINISSGVIQHLIRFSTQKHTKESTPKKSLSLYREKWSTDYKKCRKLSGQMSKPDHEQACGTCMYINSDYRSCFLNKINL